MFSKDNEDKYETVQAVDGPVGDEEIKTGYDAEANLEIDTDAQVGAQDAPSGTTALRMVAGVSYSGRGYRATLDDVIEVDDADVDYLLSLRVSATSQQMFERA